METPTEDEPAPILTGLPVRLTNIYTARDPMSTREALISILEESLETEAQDTDNFYKLTALIGEEEDTQACILSAQIGRTTDSANSSSVIQIQKVEGNYIEFLRAVKVIGE
jgi:hypothetical protein